MTTGVVVNNDKPAATSTTTSIKKIENMKHNNNNGQQTLQGVNNLSRRKLLTDAFLLEAVSMSDKSKSDKGSVDTSSSSLLPAVVTPGRETAGTSGTNCGNALVNYLKPSVSKASTVDTIGEHCGENGERPTADDEDEPAVKSDKAHNSKHTGTTLTEKPGALQSSLPQGREKQSVSSGVCSTTRPTCSKGKVPTRSDTTLNIVGAKKSTSGTAAVVKEHKKTTPTATTGTKDAAGTASESELDADAVAKLIFENNELRKSLQVLQKSVVESMAGSKQRFCAHSSGNSTSSSAHSNTISNSIEKVAGVHADLLKNILEHKKTKIEKLETSLAALQEALNEEKNVNAENQAAQERAQAQWDREKSANSKTQEDSLQKLDESEREILKLRENLALKICENTEAKQKLEDANSELREHSTTIERLQGAVAALENEKTRTWEKTKTLEKVAADRLQYLSGLAFFCGVVGDRQFEKFLKKSVLGAWRVVFLEKKFGQKFEHVEKLASANAEWERRFDKLENENAKLQGENGCLQTEKANFEVQIQKAEGERERLATCLTESTNVKAEILALQAKLEKEKSEFERRRASDKKNLEEIFAKEKQNLGQNFENLEKTAAEQRQEIHDLKKSLEKSEKQVLENTNFEAEIRTLKSQKESRENFFLKREQCLLSDNHELKEKLKNLGCSDYFSAASSSSNTMGNNSDSNSSISHFMGSSLPNSRKNSMNLISRFASSSSVSPSKEKQLLVHNDKTNKTVLASAEREKYEKLQTEYESILKMQQAERRLREDYAQQLASANSSLQQFSKIFEKFQVADGEEFLKKFEKLEGEAQKKGHIVLIFIYISYEIFLTLIIKKIRTASVKYHMSCVISTCMQKKRQDERDTYPRSGGIAPSGGPSGGRCWRS